MRIRLIVLGALLLGCRSRPVEDLPEMDGGGRVQDGPMKADLTHQDARGGQPDWARSLDLAATDLAASDLSVPDLPVPDLAFSDLTTPDLTVRDLATPDLTVLDLVTPDFARPPPNYIFVTSKTYRPAVDFKSVAEADAICNQLAAGKLPGRYVAWLSTTKVSAAQHVFDQNPRARGWVRPDGRPFADSLETLCGTSSVPLALRHQVFYPPEIDENGANVATSRTSWMYYPVITGTSADCTVTQGGASWTCADWTAASADGGLLVYGAGAATGGAFAWTYVQGIGCGGAARLYCLGVDNASAVAVTPGAGRTVFVTRGSYHLTGGLAEADKRCNTEAATHNLAGTYRAALATWSSSAAARFDLLPDGGLPPDTPTWVRPDGVRLVDEPGQLFEPQRWLLAPPDVLANGTYAERASVWTGSGDPSSMSNADTCGDWTSASGQGGSGWTNGWLSGLFTAKMLVPCSSSLRLLCLESP